MAGGEAHSQAYDGFDAQQAMLAMAGWMSNLQQPEASQSAPPVDPVMAQAYMQMLAHFQQGFAAQAPMGSGDLGMPFMPMPGIPSPYTPSTAAQTSINVTVEGMKFQYQLTEDDLNKVFSRYGAVSRISVDDAGAAAVITFSTAQDAQAAMNDLNGKVLNGLDGTLRISWAAGSAAPVPPPYPGMPFNGWGGMPAPPASLPGLPSLPGMGLPGMPQAPAPPVDSHPVDERPKHVKGVRKYTCRFLIGIENDKEFQVARRIIGAKGDNMKQIVKQTEAKLRLRGQGSGYCEGAGQKESAEPLQLCISCTSPDGYKMAVQQVEGLLKKVYEEYRSFCRDNGRPVPNLQVNLSENLPSALPGALWAQDAAPADGGGAEGGSPGRDGRRGRRSRGGKKDKDAGKGGDGRGLERGEPGPNAPSVDEIEKYIDDRNEARRANKFQEADRIREFLHARGVALMDEPGGRGRGAEVTTWRYWRD